MASDDNEMNMENRDPNNLNDQVQILFDDVLAEPDGSHSVDCVWRNSYKCFSCCKDCCYKFMTLFCGIPFAIMWGCEFAVITFIHVWYITPCMKMYLINCGCLQRFYAMCVQCYVRPLWEAYGYCFNNIRVTNVTSE